MQVVDEEATKEKQIKADEEAKEAGKEAADPVEPATRSESKEVWDWRVQNDNKPLWTRTPKEVRTQAIHWFFLQTRGHCVLTRWGAQLDSLSLLTLIGSMQR